MDRIIKSYPVYVSGAATTFEDGNDCVIGYDQICVQTKVDIKPGHVLSGRDEDAELLGYVVLNAREGIISLMPTNEEKTIYVRVREDSEEILSGMG